MMTEPLEPATDPGSGAAMDRRVKRTRAPWWRRRATMVAAVLLIGSITFWRFLPSAGSTDVSAAEIESALVERAAFDDYLPVRATVAPAITTLVGVMSGGQVEQLLAQDGALVETGQPLARLVNPELELDVVTREAQIASQLGGLASDSLGIERSRLDRAGQVAQANYELIRARRELDIRRQLHEQGFLADAGVRSFAEEVEYQERRLAQLRTGSASEARITATQAARLDETRNRLTGNLAAVRNSLDALTIRAPADGRLTNFILQPGQTLKPGDPAGQIDSEGAWKLEADVDEYFLGRVRAGQRAVAGQAHAIVSKVLPAVTNGRFRIELTFEGEVPPRLNRGQAIDVRITLGASSQAVIAPLGGWMEAGGGSSAFVLDADGRHARRRVIETGRRNASQVEILSGVQPGERIVISSTASIKGDILNIR